MNSPRLLLAALSATALLAFSASAANDTVVIPLPGGQEVSGILAVIDESETNWKFLPLTISATDNGFSGSFKAPSGDTSTIEGRFENRDGALHCSVKWEGAAVLSQTFVMLSMAFPADQVQDTMLISGTETINVPKLLAGEPTRANFNRVSAFTMGPVDGKQLSFACETPLDVGVVVLQNKDFAHVRLGLTPRKSDMPASGEAIWTIGQ